MLILVEIIVYPKIFFFLNKHSIRRAVHTYTGFVHSLRYFHIVCIPGGQRKYYIITIVIFIIYIENELVYPIVYETSHEHSIIIYGLRRTDL